MRRAKSRISDDFPLAPSSPEVRREAVVRKGAR
jgi:hypothetical protein